MECHMGRRCEASQAVLRTVSAPKRRSAACFCQSPGRSPGACLPRFRVLCPHRRGARASSRARHRLWSENDRPQVSRSASQILRRPRCRMLGLRTPPRVSRHLTAGWAAAVYGCRGFAQLHSPARRAPPRRHDLRRALVRQPPPPPVRGVCESLLRSLLRVAPTRARGAQVGRPGGEAVRRLRPPAGCVRSGAQVSRPASPVAEPRSGARVFALWAACPSLAGLQGVLARATRRTEVEIGSQRIAPPLFSDLPRL